MKTLSYFLLLFSLTPSLEKNTAIQQQEVLQTVLDIEEFQEYLSYVPRYVGSNNKQEVMMLKFTELETTDIQLNIRDKTIKIITKEDAKELEHEIFIKVTAFEIEQKTAYVTMSYQNARMYFETNQRIELAVELKKAESEVWMVDNYELDKISVNTSD